METISTVKYLVVFEGRRLSSHGVFYQMRQRFKLDSSITGEEVKVKLKTLIEKDFQLKEIISIERIV